MRVSLFITCVVDQLYPRVGEAAVELLTRLGVEVTFNPEQTCCGQPAYNTGYRREARAVAARTLDLLDRELRTSDYVVAPSGSCAAMVKKCYAELFARELEERERARRVAGRFYELSQFLVDVLGVEDVGAVFEGRVTYHDSCHLLRELGVSGAPRKLIRAVGGADFVEMSAPEACCGFGGTFSVKHPELSAAMAADKAADIERSGAEVVVACDASCMMQTAGVLSRRGSAVRCLHLAELLVSRGGQ
ncbi:MAG TPA: (Fe-S)-binding protein [Pyrinomonadaceae bacterium]|nr:(Fe-S)-binding protein [Pyrinomonadaceae bacterium]